jgi:hypothetical protein
MRHAEQSNPLPLKDKRIAPPLSKGAGGDFK